MIEKIVYVIRLFIVGNERLNETNQKCSHHHLFFAFSELLTKLNSLKSLTAT